MSKFIEYCKKKTTNELRDMASDALANNCPPESDLARYDVTPSEWWSSLEYVLARMEGTAR